jgi:hypothetical protein
MVATILEGVAEDFFTTAIGTRSVNQVDAGVKGAMYESNGFILGWTPAMAGRMNSVFKAKFNGSQGKGRDP